MQKIRLSLWFLILEWTLTLTAVNQAQTNPLSKVFELIGELRKEIVADGEREDKAYQELYDWCGRTSRDIHYELETASTAVSKLTAKVDKLESEIEVAESEISDQAARVAKSEKELNDATAIRKKEAEEFKDAESELMATVDTLERALAQLEKQLSAGGSFTQIDESSLMNIVQTLSVVDNAAALSGESMDALAALVQAHDDEGDPDAPAAAAYQKQSGGIMQVLEDLKDKAEKQLDELRKNELASKQSYELVKQGLEDETKARNKEMEQEKSSKAANSEEKAAASGELETAARAKASAKKEG
jgi:DNA repair exonuclease SbcCD ATPase subunit